jgi:Spy/CpxP family protein refolding chaperone
MTSWKAGFAGAVLALVVVVLLGASTALSKPGHGGCRGHGAGARFDRLEEKLGTLSLDESTRAAASRLIAQARTESEARREEMRDARGALRELLAQDTPSVDAVMAQADVVGALETESHKAKLRTMIELRSLLGPERWQELRESLHEKRGERMEKS